MNFCWFTEINVYFGMLSSAAKLKRSAEVMYVIKHNHKVLKVIKSDEWMLLNALERPVKSVPNLLPLSIAFLNFSIITKRQCWVLHPFRILHWLEDNIVSKCW